MSSAAQELIAIVDGLPEDKAREVVDFARFLQQQYGDREWIRISVGTPKENERCLKVLKAVL